MDENIDSEKIREATQIDNSRLEELLQLFKDDPSPKTVQELGEEIKRSQLFLPVIYPDSMFEGIENAKEGDIIDGPSGFDINFLTTADGNKAIPLFTSSKIMEELNLRSSVIVMFVEDLVNMLQGAEETYELVTINPMTETGIDMPILTFLNMFKEVEMDEEQRRFMESLNEMLEVLEKFSLDLDTNVTFFAKGPNDFMKEAAIDGVFVPNIPFSVSSMDFEEEGSPYTNIILANEGKKIVVFGEPSEENPFNILLAPGTEFEIFEEVDEFTTIWKIGNQPFYEK